MLAQDKYRAVRDNDMCMFRSRCLGDFRARFKSEVMSGRAEAVRTESAGVYSSEPVPVDASVALFGTAPNC